MVADPHSWRKNGDEAESPLIPMLREYTLFNVDQCDVLPDSIRGGKPMRVRNLFSASRFSLGNCVAKKSF